MGIVSPVNAQVHRTLTDYGHARRVTGRRTESVGTTGSASRHFRFIGHWGRAKQFQIFPFPGYHPPRPRV